VARVETLAEGLLVTTTARSIKRGCSWHSFRLTAAGRTSSLRCGDLAHSGTSGEGNR
jgi:hypothetical protein